VPVDSDAAKAVGHEDNRSFADVSVREKTKELQADALPIRSNRAAISSISERCKIVDGEGP
jgi:hypothetical protein